MLIEIIEWRDNLRALDELIWGGTSIGYEQKVFFDLDKGLLLRSVLSMIILLKR